MSAAGTSGTWSSTSTPALALLPPVLSLCSTSVLLFDSHAPVPPPHSLFFAVVEERVDFSTGTCTASSARVRARHATNSMFTL